LALNARLSERLLQLSEQSVISRNHYLGGRYENLYVALTSLPEMDTIIDTATGRARQILACAPQVLRIGWWLNIMRPGDVTFAHTHDDNDELLSGAYYIDTPSKSGNLILMAGEQHIEIATHAGMFVFFPPHVLHKVTRNLSAHSRLSVGFNIGMIKTPSK